MPSKKIMVEIMDGSFNKGKGLQLLRRPQVEAMTGLPKSTLYDYLQAGTFPAPVKLSARSVAWRLSEVEAWIESRQSARTPKEA